MREDLSNSERIIKRVFDLVFSVIVLSLTWWIIVLAAIASWVETGNNGFFRQERIGRHGRPFLIYKIRTMKDADGLKSTVTTSLDERITSLGRIFRRFKIDELPQLVNVLMGQMSFVGPRPDVVGYADKLTGKDRIVLNIRPGITGPATLYYRNEEEILARQDDPESYNDDVIFPHKVRLNRQYIEEYSFLKDLSYLMKTITN